MGFLLNNARLIGGGLIAAALIGFGIHYKFLVKSRNQLKAEKVSFQLALSKAAANMELLAEDQRIAQAATARVIIEREDARAALEAFTEGRKLDPDSVAWGATLVPLGELTRLCTALPELAGCE